MKLFCLVVVVSLCVAEEFIDLTHDLDSTAVFWPGVPSFNLSNLFAGEMPGGFWLEYNEFRGGEHGGTHMDAPAHFSRNDWHMDEIPLKRLIGPGVIIDISDRAAQDPEAQLTVDDLVKWENEHGKIPSNAFVLLDSGWTKKWPEKRLVFGSDDIENSTTFRFPSISEAAAKWLYANRPYISCVGLDTASIDPGPSRTWSAHRALLPNRIIGLENVANLDKVPASGAMIHAIPMKLKGGSGGPVRLFAVVGSSGNSLKSSQWIFFVFWFFVSSIYIL